MQQISDNLGIRFPGMTRTNNLRIYSGREKKKRITDSEPNDEVNDNRLSLLIACQDRQDIGTEMLHDRYDRKDEYIFDNSQ